MLISSLLIIQVYFCHHLLSTNVILDRYLTQSTYCITGREGRGGSRLLNKVLYGGGFAPSSKPLIFYIPFSKEKVTLSYTFPRRWSPFYSRKSAPLFDKSVADIVKSPFEYLNDSFLYSFPLYAFHIFPLRIVLCWECNPPPPGFIPGPQSADYISWSVDRNPNFKL